MGNASGVTRIVRGIVLIGLVAPGARAQSHYRNLDAGRPIRIEDAEAAARYAIDLDAAPLQLERLDGGTMRYRAEPKVGYGAWPLTEVEIRVPVVQINPGRSTGAPASAGIAGVSLGVMHAFTIESTRLPALALSAELSLPAGNLAPHSGSYFLKGLATRTTRLGRWHVNAGVGSYAVRLNPPPTSGCAAFQGSAFRVPGDTTCSSAPPIIFDTPCDVRPPGGMLAASAIRYCMAQRAETTTVVAPTGHGAHWLAGVAFDRSFAIASTLLAADVFAERFVGLYPRVDWTAEAGVRHQLTPRVVVHAGLGRHFAGVVRSTFVNAGAGFELASPWRAR